MLTQCTLQGKVNANSMHYTHTYNVLFPDGSKFEYTANMIAKNMWAQADLDGNQYLLLDSITDHRMTNEAISATNETFIL
jgi:hypothetical protein